MSGAWELPRPDVLLAILTREVVTTKWAIGFRNLIMPPSAGLSFKYGAPFDHARNMACEDALKAGYTWLFFLDDDVVAPPDTFARLSNHGADIISGLYYRRSEPILPCMMSCDAEGNAHWIEHWSPPNTVVEVDYVGSGCLLIHRRVLERMKPPWFVWELGREDIQEDRKLSEDFSFCRRAKRDHGFRIYVDTSVACTHIGLGESDPVQGFRPSRVDS